MTTSDYLINAVFVLVVLRQARERQLDLRSLVAPLALVAFVAHLYVHSIPTAGNDLVLVGLAGECRPSAGHVNRIFAKTGARDRAQAVRYAYEHGIA